MTGSDDSSLTTPSRRGFLKTVGIGAASGAVPLPATYAAQPAVLLADCEVKGLSYCLTSALVDRIALSTPLVLRRDADNGHDPNAVALLLETGETIGYVPRAQNQALAALLDAGHDLRGEITEMDRVEFETRLSGDGKPFPGRIILSDLPPDDDGARRVRMVELRPRFKAWLATGLPADAPPPDPRDVPGWPGWKRIVPEFEPRDLFGQTVASRAALIQPGVELGFEDRRDDAEDRFFVFLPDGTLLGSILYGDAESMGRAIDAGLEVKVIITRVKRDSDAPQDSFGWPWFELRCKGEPPPAPTAEQRALRQKERQAIRDARFQRDMETFWEKARERDAEHHRFKNAVTRSRSARIMTGSASPVMLAEQLREPATLQQLGATLGLTALRLYPLRQPRPDDSGFLIAFDQDGRVWHVAACGGPETGLGLDALLLDLSRHVTSHPHIVWVASRFGREQTALIDWLNATMGTELAFFGIEILEATSDGGPAVLTFSVIVQPPRNRPKPAA